MIVAVDLAAGSVSLIDPAVFIAFHVAVEHGTSDATTADAIRRWAGSTVGDWELDYSGMLG